MHATRETNAAATKRPTTPVCAFCERAPNGGLFMCARHNAIAEADSARANFQDVADALARFVKSEGRDMAALGRARFALSELFMTLLVLPVGVDRDFDPVDDEEFAEVEEALQAERHRFRREQAEIRAELAAGVRA